MARRKGSLNIKDGYRLIVTFTPEQKEWLHEKSKEWELAHAQLVRTALDCYIDQITLAESIDFRELFN